MDLTTNMETINCSSSLEKVEIFLLLSIRKQNEHAVHFSHTEKFGHVTKCAHFEANATFGKVLIGTT